MTTFDNFSDLPESVQSILRPLEDFISDLDGKTICTPCDNGEAFIDEGTVDAEEAVVAFNAVLSYIKANPAKEKG